MADNEYMPNEDQVRSAYATSLAAPNVVDPHEHYGAEFDRYLAARDREVAAKALRDAADEAQIRLGGEVSGHTSTYSVRQWLHRRADRIKRGE